ncbi:MAG: Localization factor PodJS, partial [Caulobacterales bacterium]|nr:Localization factor PodJS [Caulobacterales bacterium]
MKGIDPKAREVAKDLARRSGMTLGELLNRLILEDEEAAANPAVEPEPNPFAPSALSSVLYPSATPMREPYREEPRVTGDAPSRFRAPEHPADEVGRVTAALERLSERIEAAERRSTLAISGIDQSVRGVIGRLDVAEREHVAVAARFEGAVDELKTEQSRAADRLRRVELEAHGPRSAEALKALEQALGKVAGHLYDGEARTRQAVAEVEARVSRMEIDGAGGQDLPPLDTNEIVDAVVGRIGQRLEAAEARTAEAIETLGASFNALDGRLNTVETAGGTADRRLEELAANLSRRMEAARIEMANKLREAAEGRFDRIESRLAEMSSHVAVAEQRSAQAIERMGQEFESLANT